MSLLDRPLAESFAVVLCKDACCVRLAASGTPGAPGVLGYGLEPSHRAPHTPLSPLIWCTPATAPGGTRDSRVATFTTPPFTLTHVAVARLSLVPVWLCWVCCKGLRWRCFPCRTWAAWPEPSRHCRLCQKWLPLVAVDVRRRSLFVLGSGREGGRDAGSGGSTGTARPLAAYAPAY